MGFNIHEFFFSMVHECGLLSFSRFAVVEYCSGSFSLSRRALYGNQQVKFVAPLIIDYFLPPSLKLWAFG